MAQIVSAGIVITLKFHLKIHLENVYQKHNSPLITDIYWVCVDFVPKIILRRLSDFGLLTQVVF